MGQTSKEKQIKHINIYKISYIKKKIIYLKINNNNINILSTEINKKIFEIKKK